MTDENKALIGRYCNVEVEGEKKRGQIVDLLESMTSDEIIMYCVRLDKRLEKFKHMPYDIGTKSVELLP